MSLETNLDLVIRAFAALSSGDMPGFLDCFADDLQWAIIGQTVYSGHTAAKTI